MNEVETRAEVIDPALREVDWGVTPESRIRLLSASNSAKSNLAG